MADEPTSVCRSLPSEIVPDILSSLPVKSLCRFRCVSKSWLSLILDPHFVKMHFNKAIENEHVFYQRRRLLFTDYKHDSLYSFNLDEFLNHYNDHPFLNGIGNSNNVGVIGNDYDGDQVVTKIKLPTCVRVSEYRIGHWCLVSFCHGLVLLTFGVSEFLVANPATRKYKKLPAPSAELGARNLMYYDGFGFDHSTDDFKVISSRSSVEGLDFIVYGLKTGSWRKIQRRFPYKYYRGRGTDTGILINGRLHWLMCRPEDYSWVIVSLCLADEEVMEIPMPLDLGGAGGWHALQLGLFFNDTLCIDHTFITEFVDETQMISYDEFWVMKQYGVAESWTKMKFSSGLKCSLLPSGYWRENYALFRSRTRQVLVMYNSNDLSCQTLLIPEYPSVTGAGFYVESLVSLDDSHNFDE